MVFSSPHFLFLFLPLVLLLTCIGSSRIQNLSLLAVSLLFYYYGGGALILLLLASCVANWLLGLILERWPKRIFLALGIFFNVGILFYYKYANFFVTEFNAVAKGTELAITGWEEVALPIGISFFTFQGMSYMLDVWRKETKAYRNPLDILLCITFFPHLIAGPIVRINHLGAQLQKRTRSLNDFGIGASRFIWGLAKKVLIADFCSKVADAGFDFDPQRLHTGAAWLSVWAYTLQIYFDFSGYSDMAIGLARMFGFSFPENFNHPYTAVSITDFWRRWHMSLSQWFRDYLYIPLGGNRVSKLASYRNILIVFLVTGLWHGASWTFVVWGLFHGCIVVTEHAFKIHKLHDHQFALPRRILTLLLIMMSWVIFRSETLEGSIFFLKALVGGEKTLYFPEAMLNVMDLQTFLAFAIGSASVLLGRNWTGGNLIEDNTALSQRLRWVLILFVFPATISQVVCSDYSPFLYFKF